MILYVHASTPTVEVCASRHTPVILRLLIWPHRTLDPILGVATGIFAYYLYETHPRTGLPEELRLMSLLRWKRERLQQQREQKLMATGEDTIDWQAIAATVEADTSKGSSK